jgi:hypothetical protein
MKFFALTVISSRKLAARSVNMLISFSETIPWPLRMMNAREDMWKSHAVRGHLGPLPNAKLNARSTYARSMLRL